MTNSPRTRSLVSLLDASPAPQAALRDRKALGRARRAACSILAFGTLATLGCDSAPPEPEPRRPAKVEAESKSESAPAKPKAATATVPKSPDDPLGGKFTLEEAVAGLPSEGKLVALMKTSLGTLSCELFEDKAPITVANFVGLARGLRPFKDASGEWVKRPGYDGTTFHRVIKGFMIQGGDPKGTGAGEPGYVIPDEIWPGAKHDERGLLCMANRGPNTNGMQFFILDGPAPHLDGGYTIFGKCSPPEVIEKIASTKTRGDRAIDPPRIESVTIERKK